jgi:serine protease AprX
VDFTGGSGLTSDPYGHGTHVAAIAAGNGIVSQGAYMGIAPDANILNLRVLDGRARAALRD